jgi:hypothetical protein
VSFEQLEVRYAEDFHDLIRVSVGSVWGLLAHSQAAVVVETVDLELQIILFVEMRRSV